MRTDKLSPSKHWRSAVVSTLSLIHYPLAPRTALLCAVRDHDGRPGKFPVARLALRPGGCGGRRRGSRASFLWLGGALRRGHQQQQLPTMSVWCVPRPCEQLPVTPQLVCSTWALWWTTWGIQQMQWLQHQWVLAALACSEPSAAPLCPIPRVIAQWLEPLWSAQEIPRWNRLPVRVSTTGGWETVEAQRQPDRRTNTWYVGSFTHHMFSNILDVGGRVYVILDLNVPNTELFMSC